MHMQIAVIEVIALFRSMDFLKNPSVIETFVDILLCVVPIWLAVMIGLVIGWSWRPRWTGIVFLGFRSKFRFLWTAPPGFGARRFWFAFTAFSALSVCRTIWGGFRRKEDKLVVAAPEAGSSLHLTEGRSSSVVSPIIQAAGKEEIVTQKDLNHLLHLLDGKVGEWQSMMDKSTPNMSYQAWCHEPEKGLIVYRSRTVFEDATPELVRDFFWDDEFRPNWDPMLTYFKILEECPCTGTMIVHWIKKFPFFCSDREYIIGRRIWEAGKTYYCVTKGVPYSGLKRHDKPRRVELYFSSWIIKAVESRKGDGQMSACEVTLLHHEDMGIPKDVAKLGVRHGMWGALKKLHSGMRAYQNARKLSEASLSKCALMARIPTKITFEENPDSFESGSGDEEKNQVMIIKKEKDHKIDWKWVVIGGTVALVCGVRTGVIGKALLLGAGRRIAQR